MNKYPDDPLDGISIIFIAMAFIVIAGMLWYNNKGIFEVINNLF